MKLAEAAEREEASAAELAAMTATLEGAQKEGADDRRLAEVGRRSQLEACRDDSRHVPPSLEAMPPATWP